MKAAHAEHPRPTIPCAIAYVKQKEMTWRMADSSTQINIDRPIASASSGNFKLRIHTVRHNDHYPLEES